MYDEKNKSSILPLEKFFLFLFDIANGNFIFPLSIDEMSDTLAKQLIKLKLLQMARHPPLV